MDFVKRRWKRTAAHVVIGVAVAAFAWYSLKSEASLANRSVHLMPLDSAPSE
ncbi:MAG TPA: hypothetical protein VMK66_12235 [Myxococcales bacterium]|nr:hypothetical protein [Myxococcales bacterium]